MQDFQQERAWRTPPREEIRLDSLSSFHARGASVNAPQWDRWLLRCRMREQLLNAALHDEAAPSFFPCSFPMSATTPIRKDAGGNQNREGVNSRTLE